MSILSGPHQGQKSFVLKDVTVFEVGRAAGSHIRIRDEGVAMNHCRLFKRDEEFTLYALSDKKPTIVNGEKVQKVALKHGDRLTLGGTEILFELVAAGKVGRTRARASDKPKPPRQDTQRRHVPQPVEAPAAEPSLVVVDGENRGAVFQLKGKKRFKIGRSSKSDVRLADTKVSRDHCLIEQVHAEYVLIDLESSNGTIVNGERVRKTVLKDNDFLRLGFTVLKFQATR